MVNETVRPHAMEEWVFDNTNDSQHPLHIHVNDFQVVD